MFPAERASKPVLPNTALSASQLSALIEDLPEGFQELARRASFSLNTLEVLGRAVHACRWSGRICDAQKLPGPAPSAPSFNDFLEACPCLFGPNSGRVSLDKLVLLTVLLRIFLLDVPRMLTAGVVGARAELSRQIFVYEPTTQPEHDLMVWVVVSTVEAWHFQDPSLNAQDARGLVTEFLRRYPSMRDLSALRGTLVRFFGVPQESRLRLIHQAMMQYVAS